MTKLQPCGAASFQGINQMQGGENIQGPMRVMRAAASEHSCLPEQWVFKGSEFQKAVPKLGPRPTSLTVLHFHFDIALCV